MSGRRGLSAVARVAVGTTLAIAAGITLLSAVSYAIVARSLDAQVDDRLAHETASFADAIARTAPSDQAALRSAIRAYLATHSAPSAGRAPILVAQLASGHVISNSEVRLESLWSTAAAEPKPRFSTVVHDGIRYRVASTPVLGAGTKPLGVFRAALSLEETRALRKELATTLTLIGAAVTMLGAAVSVWVARAALAPLARVAATVESVGDAPAGERVAYEGPRDEVGTLVDALNRMLERVESAFAEQKRFVADASHELRTPLAVARGHLELARRNETEEHEQSESLHVVGDELARMERIVTDLLELAALEGGHHQRPFQPLDVPVLLAEVAGRSRTLGATDVRVDEADEAWVLGDPDLLEQALVNLVKNALAAGGPDVCVRLRAHALEDRVRIVVSDSGPGIPPEDLDRVFERFYRGAHKRSDTDGTGLGLAITARIAALHAGTVRAANRPEGGAAFTVELPRLRDVR